MTSSTRRVPRFSIVVPTRDRPEFLDFCLASIAAQRFEDFEVIVSDNHTGRSARAVFDRHADERFVYVEPPQPLGMSDNWEFACGHARGDYVAVVIDKTVVHSCALETANRALERDEHDIVSWRNEGYNLLDEHRSLGPGTYRPSLDVGEPTVFEPLDEVARRSSMAVRRGEEGVHYGRGKICFGMFGRALLDRMRELTGRLFFPLAPDYTSMIAAAAAGATAVDLGRPLLMSFNSMTSNGRRQALDPQHALRFIRESDPTGDVERSLPIPGLYAAVHNVVASDYVRVARHCAGVEIPEVNLSNLAIRAREDLAEVQWPDAVERGDQYARLEVFERALGPRLEAGATTRNGSRRSIRGALLARLASVPVFERLALRALGHPVARRYDSILGALADAEPHYDRLS